MGDPTQFPWDMFTSDLNVNMSFVKSNAAASHEVELDSKEEIEEVK